MGTLTMIHLSRLPRSIPGMRDQQEIITGTLAQHCERQFSQCCPLYHGRPTAAYSQAGPGAPPLPATRTAQPRAPPPRHTLACLARLPASLAPCARPGRPPTRTRHLPRRHTWRLPRPRTWRVPGQRHSPTPHGHTTPCLARRPRHADQAGAPRAAHSTTTHTTHVLACLDPGHPEPGRLTPTYPPTPRIPTDQHSCTASTAGNAAAATAATPYGPHRLLQTAQLKPPKGVKRHNRDATCISTSQQSPKVLFPGSWGDDVHCGRIGWVVGCGVVTGEAVVAGCAVSTSGWPMGGSPSCGGGDPVAAGDSAAVA